MNTGHPSTGAAARHHGTLTRWNDERGFGFIAPAGGGAEIFAHISAFPHDGRRPQVGEVITDLTQAGPDGKVRAVNVMRPGQSHRRPVARRPRPARRTRTGLAGVLGVVLVAALGWLAYERYAAVPASVAAPAAALQADPRFSCSGKTHCSQMRSCAEATFYLRHCPNTQMDGDGDGVPCEQQWCR